MNEFFAVNLRNRFFFNHLIRHIKLRHHIGNILVLNWLQRSRLAVVRLLWPGLLRLRIMFFRLLLIPVFILRLACVHRLLNSRILRLRLIRFFSLRQLALLRLLRSLASLMLIVLLRLLRLLNSRLLHLFRLLFVLAVCIFLRLDNSLFLTQCRFCF